MGVVWVRSGCLNMRLVIEGTAPFVVHVAWTFPHARLL